MAHHVVGDCVPCCGQTTDCNAENCCSGGPMPDNVSVSVPAASGSVDCDTFIARNVSLPKATETPGDPCQVSYFSEVGLGYFIEVALVHSCALGTTSVCIRYNRGAPSLYLYWCDKFNDPEGRIYCGLSAEVPPQGVGDCSECGFPAGASCTVGNATVG